MSVPQPKITTLTGLARRLVEYQILSPEQAEEAFSQSLKERKSFVTYLFEKKLVSNCCDLAMAVAEEFGVPVVDIDSIDLEAAIDTIKKIDEKLLNQYKALPIFERGNRLFVAISDPTNLSALDAIRFRTKMNTEPVVVEADKLAKVIERALEIIAPEPILVDPNELVDIDLVDEDEGKKGEDDEGDAEKAPIIQFVNRMLYDAIKMGASDLHFEPYEKLFRVRFRVDGMLRLIATPPVGLARKLAARLKVMSRLDVSERRVPQDGRIKIKYGKGSIDFRVSSMPTLFGEKVVLRILDNSAANLDIDKLGYEPEQKQLYLEALRNPYGMVLVTGPTGPSKLPQRATWSCQLCIPMMHLPHLLAWSTWEYPPLPLLPRSI